MASSRSKRRRSNSFDSTESIQSVMSYRQVLAPSIRSASTCIHMGFNKTTCCSGCVEYANRVNIDIDNREQDEAMAKAITSRAAKYTSPRFQCLQLWRTTTEEMFTLNHSRRTLATNQKNFVKQIHKRNPSRLKTPSAPRRLSFASPVPIAGAVVTPDPPSTPLADSNRVAEQPILIGDVLQSPTKIPDKTLRNIRQWNNYKFTSQGHPFDFDLPSSHVIIPSSYFEGLKNDRAKLKQFREVTNLERFSCRESVSRFKAFIATALASVPALAITAAAYLIPLVVTGFLHCYGFLELIPTNLKKNFHKSFPSAAYLRGAVMAQATEDMVWLSEELQDKYVYISCDKGNKKKVGHFVKYVSWTDDDGEIQVHLLDLDASEGTAVDCAKAIEASLRKLGLNGRKVILRGQATDSGGGGVLDNLARELQALKLCVKEEEYLIGACGIHCLQLQLSVPTSKLIGDGSPGVRNAIQLLNGIHYLQGYFDRTELHKLMSHAQQWADQYCNEDYVGTTEGDIIFGDKWNKVRRYRNFKPIGEITKWKQCTQCVATRWQFIGEAASYGWENYLVVFKFTQMVINAYPADSKKNKAASELQSNLLEPYFFSDIALLNCFHIGYFKVQMNWMMQAKDLTNVTGFQTHQMLLRYHKMECSLMALKADVGRHGSFFHDFNQTLKLKDTDGTLLLNDEEHKKKAINFIDRSIESLQKHFKRWTSPQLLPAALLSEKTIAMSVARVMTGTPASFPVKPQKKDFIASEDYFKSISVYDKATIFFSRAQRENVYMPGFEKWLKDVVGSDVTYRGYDMLAATSLLQDVDFRIFKGSPEVVKEMWKKYLPLASQTQFVERGVKEAKLVASTDRLEEQRSAYAIVRSFQVLVAGIEKYASAPTRIKRILESIEAHLYRRESLIATYGTKWYVAMFKEAEGHLHGNHYKHERLEGLVSSVLGKADRNKKTDNVRQRATGVAMTVETLGLISYKDLFKDHHTVFLLAELDAREYNDIFYGDDHDDKRKRGKQKNFTDLRNALKALELKRIESLQPAVDDARKELTTKGFEKMCDIAFVLKE